MSKLGKLAKNFKDKLPKRPSFASAELEQGLENEDDKALKEILLNPDPDSDYIGMTVGVEYKDDSNNVSKRWVSIVKFANSFAGYHSIRGYCFMREDLRTFRIDRIVNLFNEEGNSYEMSDLFKVNAISDQSSYVSIIETKHWPKLRDALRVLIAVARSDGYLHPKEVDVIGDYIRDQSKSFGFPLNQNDILHLENFINKQQPCGDVVADCLTRLSEADQKCQETILEYLQKTIYADGILAQEEIEISAEIYRRFNEKNA